MLDFRVLQMIGFNKSLILFTFTRMNQKVLIWKSRTTQWVKQTLSKISFSRAIYIFRKDVFFGIFSSKWKRAVFSLLHLYFNSNNLLSVDWYSWHSLTTVLTAFETTRLIRLANVRNSSDAGRVGVHFDNVQILSGRRCTSNQCYPHRQVILIDQLAMPPLNEHLTFVSWTFLRECSISPHE